MPIYRDKRTGRWRFDFDRYIGGVRHRHRQLLPRGFTRSDAEAFDRQKSAALYAIAQGIARPRFTIDQAVHRYLAERGVELKNTSLANELHTTRDWWAGRAIEDLPAVCAEYADDQAGALAPATIRNRLRYLTAACRYAWRKHAMADRDPAERVIMPTVSNERDVYISRAQMLQLARACRQWETRAMIRVAFYSGMRYSEIVAAQLDGQRFILRDTKNGEPRIVPVHPKIRRVLGYGWAWPQHETMSYYFREARAAVGMPWLHFHDLRHSAASAMLNAGVPLFTVGAVLGHKSSASTQRYSHHATEALAEAVGRIGRRA
jgi:integrase